MSSELAVRVIDALDEGLSHMESVCVHLYGGEPLTNLPAIEAMLDRSSEKESGHFSFAVTTNGTCDVVLKVIAGIRQLRLQHVVASRSKFYGRERVARSHLAIMHRWLCNGPIANEDRLLLEVFIRIDLSDFRHGSNGL